MTKQLKYILIVLLSIIAAVAAIILYRIFWQFDWKEIQVYVREQAAKYRDSTAAARIITDGVEHILSSHNLTQQVLRSAKATKTDPEQELVNAAINQCIAYNYLPSREV